MGKPKEEQEMELMPVETEEMEMASVIHEGDPATQLAILEQRAALAPRTQKAINTILMVATFPEDWTIQGDKACLGSAGAERVARHFVIRFYDQKCERQEFADKMGSGYRYVYTCKACMGDREIFAQGAYGTRDKFLGFKDGEWRPLEDINENNMRNGAYHICLGNAIKSMLGLRGIPVKRWREIMGQAGEDTSKVADVKRAAPANTEDDKRHQKELANICIALAQGGCTAVRNGDGDYDLEQIGEGDDRAPMDVAKATCVALSSFVGQAGKEVAGRLASELTGKRLEITLARAKEMQKDMQEFGADSEGGEESKEI